MGTISSTVIKYVEKGDVEATRTALITVGYIGDYDSLVVFKKSTDYANEKLEDLFQEDDGKEYNTSFSVAAYKNVIKLMMNNFSEKKYRDAVQIGKSVFKNNKPEDSKIRNEAGKGAPKSDGFFQRLKKKLIDFWELIRSHPFISTIIALGLMVLVILLVIVLK